MALSTQTILDVAHNVTADVTVIEHHGDLTLKVSVANLLDVLRELKEHADTAFDQLIDITAIDWAKPGERFEVVYILYSLSNKSHVRVKVGVREDNPHVPTAVDVWEGANWYEREAYDMYGIIFDGHPDLRRFYMPEAFMDASGEPLYPLRKDFPLMGIPGSLPLPPKGDMQQ